MSIQGRGEPSGSWLLGAGGRFGLVAMSGAAASGVSPRIQVHFAGRRVLQRTLSREVEPKEEQAEEKEEGLLEWFKRLRKPYDQLTRWVEPQELLSFVVAQRHHVKLRLLQTHVEYSFVDIALTGKCLAALSVLGGCLVPPLSLTQKVSWRSEDQASLRFTLEARVWPLRILGSSLWFLLTKVSLFRFGRG